MWTLLTRVRLRLRAFVLRHRLEREMQELPVGPVTVIAALGVVATVTIAAWLPARHAARVDPAVALHAE